MCLLKLRYVDIVVLLLRRVCLERNPIDDGVLLDLFFLRLSSIKDALIAQQSYVLIVKCFLVINSWTVSLVTLSQPQMQACRCFTIKEAFHVEVLVAI